MKYKNVDAKVKWVAGEKRELKRELVEAKPDGTIFSLSTKLQRTLYTITKSREVPITVRDKTIAMFLELLLIT